MVGETEQLDRVEASLEEIERLLENGQLDAAIERLTALHPADQAEVISELEDEERALVLPRLSQDALAQVLEYLREEPRVAVVADIDDHLLGRLLDQVDRDVAVDVLHALDGERARRVLAGMARALELAPLLQHKDESAGGRMTSDFVALPRGWTVEQTLAHLRQWRPKADQAYYLYVVDPQQRLEGVVSLRNLVVARPEERIADLMTTDVVSVQVGEDQEEVARRIRRYNFIALPVVDEQRRLVGVVNVDDLIDVVAEEATEDMYRMVGIGTQETVFSPVRLAAQRRIPWLLINLGTAFLSALTVRAFQDTISDVAALAIFMPVIAGHGGNTGTQVITLVVRGLALGEVRPADVWRIAWKEVRFGAVHGLLAGMLTAALALALTQNTWLALVVFCAMQGNIVVAAVIGSALPLVMRRLGIDPALASAIWLTTFTDVVGFLLLLGLGTGLLSQLT